MTSEATELPTERTTELGRYIQSKRDEAGLSQEKLAERLQTFTQTAVSAWERGSRIPTAKAIIALARELPGADVDEMLALIEDQP